PGWSAAGPPIVTRRGIAWRRPSAGPGASPERLPDCPWSARRGASPADLPPRLSAVECALPVLRALLAQPRPLGGRRLQLNAERRVRPALGARSAVSGTWDKDTAGAFVEQLFAKHHGEIYAYLVRMLRDGELAADLTQDAFVKAYRNYNVLEKPENARAWLYQIAHRVALDHIRRQKIVRFLPWTGESHGSAPSTERLVMDAHLSGDLQRALAKIPERQRAALLLAELHDLTGLELAAALGVSHVAARALLTRARESLRQALAAERQAEADAEATTDAASSARTDRRAGTARC